MKNKEINHAQLMRVAAILGILYAVLDFVFTSIVTKSFEYNSLMQNMMLIICLSFLLYAYKKHDKNVMNMVAGALMMALYMLQVQYSSLPGGEAFMMGWLMNVGNFALRFVLLAAFVNHLVATLRHNSSAAQAELGQILLLIAVALAFIQIVVCIFTCGDLVHFFNWSSWYFMLVFGLATLVALENQLNEFKKAKK